jgi:hypothetical protein
MSAALSAPLHTFSTYSPADKVRVPTGGGKSVILNALARAQTRLGRRTTLHVVNPKSISVSELYGVLDKDTRDWTDGLLSNIFRWVAGGTLPCCCLHCKYIHQWGGFA